MSRPIKTGRFQLTTSNVFDDINLEGYLLKALIGIDVLFESLSVAKPRKCVFRLNAFCQGVGEVGSEKVRQHLYVKI